MRAVAIFWGLASAVVLAVACASAGGEGSETHFVCTRDDECPSHGADFCVDGYCALVGTPATDDSKCVAGNSLSSPTGGFAPLYGCHAARRATNDSGCFASQTVRKCTAEEPNPPSALPCGSCTADDRCVSSIITTCDCDGDGPRGSFVQTDSSSMDLTDGWICQCTSGTWECLLRDRSASSCFNLCLEHDSAAAR